ncbi:MAG: acetyl-CoA C-acetyltransferase, partial [Solirubrobacteraceae bacterium]
MEDAVIVSALRTPVGSFGGQFKDIAATELGAKAVRATLERAKIAGDEVDEVVLGCVLTAGLGQNPARQVAIGAGIPKEVPATTINMVCGSGLKAVAIASQMIRAGDVNVVVAGGMENMTRAPYLMPAARFGARTGDAQLIDSMVHDGLWDAFNDIHMGITAENLAEQYGISREEQDQFAAESQHKAERAVAEGIFREEIVPVEVPVKGGTRMVDGDEAPRAGTTPDALAKLRTAFRRDGGTVTAGNASGINDGASAIVLMSATTAKARGLRTFGTVESYASVGVEPKIMGIGPVPAVRKALARAGLELGDIDLFELNEAFAAQSLAVLRELDIDPELINPRGGAIALGHPIGASGGRILVTLLHEMRRRDSHRGLATLCVGGGQGQAAIIRNG